MIKYRPERRCGSISFDPIPAGSNGQNEMATISSVKEHFLFYIFMPFPDRRDWKLLPNGF